MANVKIGNKKERKKKCRLKNGEDKMSNGENSEDVYSEIKNGENFFEIC